VHRIEREGVECELARLDPRVVAADAVGVERLLRLRLFAAGGIWTYLSRGPGGQDGDDGEDTEGPLHDLPFNRLIRGICRSK
jgi:hypothetical protein